jgi:hypothetical protein
VFYAADAFHTNFEECFVCSAPAPAVNSANKLRLLQPSASIRIPDENYGNFYPEMEYRANFRLLRPYRRREEKTLGL